MKIFSVYRFEIVYQLSRVSTWISAVTILALTVLFGSSFIDNARQGELVMNSPIVIAAIASFSSIFSLILIAALAGDAGRRDEDSNMAALIYTTPLDKLAYLAGRYLAISTITFGLAVIAVPLSVFLISLVPGAKPEYFGDPMISSYLAAYVMFSLPNALFLSAMLFGIVVVTRTVLGGYVLAALIFFLTVLSMDILAGPLARWDLAQMLDASGFTVLKILRKSWTPIELPVRTVTFHGFVLYNRITWLAGGLLVGILAWLSFSFKHKASHRGMLRSTLIEEPGPVPTNAAPSYERRFNFRQQFVQTIFLAWSYFRQSLKGWSIPVILACGVLLFHVMNELLEGPLGVPLIPTTASVVNHFRHRIIEMIVSVIPILLSGHLVWYHRDKRINDLVDASPVRNWSLMLSQFLSITLFVCLIQLLMIAVGVTIQFSRGYHAVDWSLYVKVFLGVQMINYLLIAAVAMLMHVAINHKFIAYLLSIIFYASTVLPHQFGLTHNLAVFTSDPGMIYSDMTGFEGLLPWILFKAYWIAWSCVFLLIAKFLWVRGRAVNLEDRSNTFLSVISKQSQLVLLSPFVVISILFGVIFYNTNILNHASTVEEQKNRRILYERRYKNYEDDVQPVLTDVDLNIDIFPADKSFNASIRYWLKNISDRAIDTLYFTTSPAKHIETEIMPRPDLEILNDDEETGFIVLGLPDALRPGDSTSVSFSIRQHVKGFEHDEVIMNVAENGTILRSDDFLPVIGYQRSRELADNEARSMAGLVEREAIPSLDDTTARYRSRGREPINFHAVIGTNTDETGVAPGILKRNWIDNDRRYFEYKSEAPITNDFAILSSSYNVTTEHFNGYDLQVFHHPSHSWNVSRMMRSMKDALAYHTKNFGPYPLKQLKLVEYPGKGALTSFAGMIIYPEDFAQMAPDQDWRNIDLPYAVIAHEVAHQWWGNQLVPAFAEGAPLLTESLAWYCALGVVEQTHGPRHMSILLEVMKESYLSPRSKAGPALVRSYDRFLGYRKGAFAMHALRQYVGEDSVNNALSRLLKTYPLGTFPLVTSSDLYFSLERVTPDSLQQLLSDLFQSNTYWDVRTEDATVEKLQDGIWKVSFEVLTSKTYVDKEGNETAAILDEPVDIAVFGEDENAPPLYYQRHRIRSREERFSIIVKKRPYRVGADPDNLLIDTNLYDNIIDCNEQVSASTL